METLKKLLRDWRFWIVVGVLVIASWTLGPSVTPFTETSPSPSPTPSAQASQSIRPTTASEVHTSRLTSVIPSAGKIGTQITIKGTGFSRTGNTITLRGKNKNISPWYILKAPNFLSSDEGTIIIMTISPSIFIYGECRATDAFCENRVQKIEPGEYTLTVQPANCPPASCTSNGLQFILVQ